MYKGASKERQDRANIILIDSHKQLICFYFANSPIQELLYVVHM